MTDMEDPQVGSFLILYFDLSWFLDLFWFFLDFKHFDLSLRLIYFFLKLWSNSYVKDIWHCNLIK